MITGDQYIKVVKSYFQFLTTEFNFTVFKENVRGNVFYNVEYKDQARVVSVSYENLEDFLQVIIFMLRDGELPDYDDKTRTLHLSRLNEKILSNIHKDVIRVNSEYFSIFNPENSLEKKILKSAKELRLFLKYAE